jgi:hypothetical protein
LHAGGPEFNHSSPSPEKEREREREREGGRERERKVIKKNEDTELTTLMNDSPPC